MADRKSPQESLAALTGYSNSLSPQEMLNTYLGYASTKYTWQGIMNIINSLPSTQRSVQENLWHNLKDALSLTGEYTKYSPQEYLEMAVANSIDIRDIIYNFSSTIVSPTVLNGGFETDGAGGDDVFLNWTENKSGTSTVNKETVAPYAGNNACRLDVDASNSAALVATGAVLTVDKKYKITLYAKANSGTPSYKIYGASATLASQTLTTSYVLYTHYITADATTLTFCRNSATSKSIFLDDITVKTNPN